MQEKLKLWAEEWSWGKESLYHTTIGTPVQIINDLKEGMYKPNVTKGVERSALAWMKVKSNHDKKLQKELQHDWENIHEAITLIDNHAEQVVVEEIPILDFTEEFSSKRR